MISYRTKCDSLPLYNGFLLIILYNCWTVQYGESRNTFLIFDFEIIFQFDLSPYFTILATYHQCSVSRSMLVVMDANVAPCCRCIWDVAILANVTVQLWIYVTIMGELLTGHMQNHCGRFALHPQDGDRLYDSVTVKCSFFTGRTARSNNRTSNHHVWSVFSSVWVSLQPSAFISLIYK